MMQDDKLEAAGLAEDAGMVQKREIAVITMEIRTLHKQAQQLILGYAIEIGRRLAEAKAQLPHGSWGAWLKDEVEFSQSTANNFMRIFEAYGAEQLGLFGPEANSQTLGNLPYTKALQLLAIPAEEREDFAKDNDVENLSSRQLEQLIRERDEAERLRKEAEEKTADLEEKLDQMEQELEDGIEDARRTAVQEAENLRASLDQERLKSAQANKDYVAALEEKNKLTAQLEKAKAAAASAKDKLKKLQDEPPVVSPEILEQMRQEATKAAQEAAAEDLETRLADAAARAQAAEKAAQEARDAEAKARKKLELSAPEVAQFQVYFAGWQEQFNKMLELLGGVQAETADKLRAAAGSVLGQMASLMEVQKT